MHESLSPDGRDVKNTLLLDGKGGAGKEADDKDGADDESSSSDSDD